MGETSLLLAPLPQQANPEIMSSAVTLNFLHSLEMFFTTIQSHNPIHYKYRTQNQEPCLRISVLPQSDQGATPAVGWSLQGWRTSETGCSREQKWSLTSICQIWQVSGTKQRVCTNSSLLVLSGGQRPRRLPGDSSRRAPWLPSPDLALKPDLFSLFCCDFCSCPQDH